MDSRIKRHRLIATVLAIILAAETVGVVAASVPDAQPAGPLVELAAAGPVLAARTAPKASPTHRPLVDTPDFDASAAPAATPSATPAPEPTAKPAKAKAKPKAEAKPKPKKVAKPKAEAKPKPKKVAQPKVSASDFRGTNHVWIPALGINKSVRAFPCDRERPPDNFMYRWGCAGENNVYLMGHAYSAMKPLHDAYYNGRLRVGLKVYYAGSNGKVRTYAVRWWKKTLPTPDASWAWAPQAKPSMTLQTCVGKDSKYRLMVRLVEVGS
jgi:hypothetical protein